MSLSNTHLSRSDEGVQISFTDPGEEQEEQEEHEDIKYPIFPTTPRGFVGLVCECHNVNWHDPLNNGGVCVYTYIDGTIHSQMEPHPTLGHPCGDKLNLRQVSMEECQKVCKYNFMDPTCALPSDVREDLVTLLSNGSGKYDERLDARSPKHYKNHYSSLKEMFDEDKEKIDKDFEMCENMDFSNLKGENIVVYGWKMFWDTDSNRLWDAETSLCCVGIMHRDENGEYIPIISEWAQETRKYDPERKARWGLPR